MVIRRRGPAHRKTAYSARGVARVIVYLLAGFILLRKGIARALAPLRRLAIRSTSRNGDTERTAQRRPSQLDLEVKAEEEQQKRSEFYGAMAQRRPSRAVLAAEAARKQVCC